MKRILIFELNWLGDILFSFPMIKSLKEGIEDAYISCAVVPRYKDLFLGNPLVDKVHSVNDMRGLPAIAGTLSFLNDIKKEKYDACFMLKPSKSKAVLANLAGIKSG